MELYNIEMTTESNFPKKQMEEIKEVHQSERQSTMGEEKPCKQTGESLESVKSIATGDKGIAILNHGLYNKGGKIDEVKEIGIELTIKNASAKTFGSILFEAILYDIEGNILDKVEYKTFELPPNIKRTIYITSSNKELDKINYYIVRVVKLTLTPEPLATGNEKITILKHSLSIEEDAWTSGARVYLAIMNASEITIASAIFEAIFYDIEGNILETTQHKEIEIKPGMSRGLYIASSLHRKCDIYKAKSYNVRLIKTTTADVEKLLIMRHEINTTEASDEEITGTIKNISNNRTDTALVASFYNNEQENIGTKVIILKEIEPNTIRKFKFTFSPQAGDVVKTYILNIGDLNTYKS